MTEDEKAMACAVRLLSRRDHAIAELESKLRGKGFQAGAVANVVARLVGAGYLDDRRFAERWAESAVRNGRGYGPRLRLELSRRGVPAETAAEVVAGISAGYDEVGTLSALAARKFPGFDPASASDRDKRRVMLFFQRRGFSASAIFGFFRSSPEIGSDCE